jgi:site-specific DNA-methyltransferase (adenine-specific)/adenine-specific DNA-methyltransferase
MDYTCRFSKQERPNLFYPIQNPFTGETVWPNEQRVWSCTSDEHAKNEAEKRLWWGKNGTAKVPAKKNFLSGIQKGMMPTSLLRYDEVGHTHEATKSLMEILPAVKMTPKPPRLIQHLAQIASNPGDLILDSFAGSGTTGHAVLNLNKADGGNRKFMLVEMETEIAKRITAERVRRVSEGYTNAKGETVEGLGGGFRFCELGEPLFDETGKIRESVRFAELARHVYFTETGEPLPRERVSKSPLLGVCRGVAVYLLYNGILGDKSASGGNVLTRAVLTQLPPFDGPRVIYCAGCLLGKERLNSERITIRQTPYEIKVS